MCNNNIYDIYVHKIYVHNNLLYTHVHKYIHACDIWIYVNIHTNGQTVSVLCVKSITSGRYYIFK